MNEQIPFLTEEDMTFNPVFAAFSEIQDWGIMATGIPLAHKQTKGAGIVVATLDTGISEHPDLAGNILPPLKANTADDPIDRNGHGTCVAGVIAAKENDMGVVGVAPEAKLLPIKVLSNKGISSYYELYQGIKLAIEANVDIISMSLNSPVVPPEVFHNVIKEAYNKGIILICAAGNNGGEVQYPAKYDEVIAVGAMDKAGNLANFSARGTDIECLAPGVDIYTTCINNTYVTTNGTSMAAPFMSGVCALLLSWARKNNIQVNNSQDMLKLLDELCDPNGMINVGKNSLVGYGIPQFANFRPWKG